VELKLWAPKFLYYDSIGSIKGIACGVRITLAQGITLFRCSKPEITSCLNRQNSQNKSALVTLELMSVETPYYPYETKQYHVSHSNSDPSVVQPVVRRYTDYAIPAPKF
jgi:ABC-type transporter lipoprotein component MlaA